MLCRLKRKIIIFYTTFLYSKLVVPICRIGVNQDKRGSVSRTDRKHVLCFSPDWRLRLAGLRLGSVRIDAQRHPTVSFGDVRTAEQCYTAVRRDVEQLCTQVCHRATIFPCILSILSLSSVYRGADFDTPDKSLCISYSNCSAYFALSVFCSPKFSSTFFSSSPTRHSSASTNSFSTLSATL